MSALTERLPVTCQLILEGIENELHTGVQLYISQGGEIVADGGVGEARPGVSMTAETNFNLGDTRILRIVRGSPKSLLKHIFV